MRTKQDATTGILGDIFRLRALRHPAGPAAVFSSTAALTAADLQNASDRLLAAMQAGYSLVPGERVVLVMPTGPSLLSALVACWQGAAVACPLDTTIHVDRFLFCLRQFSAGLVLLAPDLENLPDLLAACGREGRKVMLCPPFDARPGATPELPRILPEDPALCIFTSGSTGRPKGVLLSHAALTAGANNVITASGIGPEDRALCVLPLSHLNGLVTTFLAPMLSGGSVVYLQGNFFGPKVLSLIDRFQCTWLSAVPTHYSLLMQPPVPRSGSSLSTLRFCRSASAPLSPRLLVSFEKHYGVPVIETMGMTETAGQIFSNPMPPRTRKAGYVGKPVGYEVRLVDESGALCPAGKVGEIEVRGPGLMSGYVGETEETANAYNGSWLKSGDLAEQDGEGYYIIRGRKKEIAIFSGLNISLRALDVALEEEGNGLDAVCACEPDSVFGEVIVVYVQADPLAATPELRAVSDCIHRLTGPHLPSPQALREVRFVESIPRSAVGKPLRGLLGQSTVLFRSGRPLPRDARGLVAEILHLAEIEVDEEMGLGLTKNWDSLSHIMFLLAAEKIVGRTFSPEEVLAITTFKGLSAMLEGKPLHGNGGWAGAGGVDQETSRAREDLTALMSWNNILPDAGMVAGAPVHRPACEDGPVTLAALTSALRQAGLKAGDTLLLHSDVAALGPTEAGLDRQAVLAFYLHAFMDVLTEKGTLCVCTSFEDYGRYNVPFDCETSPSRLGAFSEYIRTRPGAIRSMHPIVSITSFGARAEEMSGGQHYDGFGYDSPWGRLHRANAKIMSLGMAGYPESGLTFLHYIEHCYGVPYQYTKLYQTPVFSKGRQMEGPFTLSVRYLDYGITYDTKKFQDLMLEKKSATRVPVGANSIFCTSCDEMMQLAVECLRANRYYFLAQPPAFRPGEIPMDGGTGKLTRVYDKGEQH